MFLAFARCQSLNARSWPNALSVSVARNASAFTALTHSLRALADDQNGFLPNEFEVPVPFGRVCTTGR